MSNRIRYAPKSDLDKLDTVPLYEISKGNKPNDIVMCNNLDRSVIPFTSGFTNKQILESITFVQVPRVQSRFRVSPSPRKIHYSQPFEMVRNF
jgi:hypothetical protein